MTSDSQSNEKAPVAVTTTSPIPRKLNQGMIATLYEYVAKGNYAKHACYLCGIDEHTLSRWLELGSQELKKEEPDKDNIYLRLFLSIKKARAQAQEDMITVARESAKAKKDGYLAITFLERTDPDNWGRRERRPVEDAGRQAVPIVRVEIILNPGNGQPPVIEGEFTEVPESTPE